MQACSGEVSMNCQEPQRTYTGIHVCLAYGAWGQEVGAISQWFQA